jgi:membrane protease YdiL (CAAX protease family)
MIFKSPLTVTLFAPIMEELFFRGIIQPLLLASILTLFPQLTGVVLFGTFSAAGICAVAITAALFGAVHLTNQKKNDAYHQAFNATFGGVVYGLLSLQFNLFTSIAAHVINNTVCITLMMMILSRLQELKADNSNSVSTDQPSLSQCSPY